LPDNCNIFILSTYKQNNDNLKPMKVIQSIILVIIAGICILPAGCVAEKDIDDNDSIIFVSNVFTPDGNEDNNFFEVTTENEDKDVLLKIYTRASVLVFSIEARRCMWDGYSQSGQPMAAGVYHYTAEIRDSSPKISKSGFVHLYR